MNVSMNVSLNYKNMHSSFVLYSTLNFCPSEWVFFFIYKFLEEFFLLNSIIFNFFFSVYLLNIKIRKKEINIKIKLITFLMT